LYLNLTRPDISFRTNMLSKVSLGENMKDNVKEARALIVEVKKTKVEIKYGPPGGPVELYLEVHADAAFGNVEEKTRSMEGAVIILWGSKGTGSPIFWRLRVIPRVCKSAKSAETFTLALIDILKSTKQSYKGRLILNNARLMEYLDLKQVKEILWVPTHMMLADSLTKAGADPSRLIKLLETGKFKLGGVLNYSFSTRNIEWIFFYR